MKTRSLKFVIAVFFAGAVFVQPSLAETISLTSSGQIGSVGDTVTVRLLVSGLSAAAGNSLGAFDVNILYDATMLSLASFSFTDATSGVNQLDLPEVGADFPFLGLVDDLGGTIDAFGVSGNSSGVLDAGQLSSFSFLSLTFQALTLGTSTVALDLTDPDLLFSNSGFSTLLPSFGPSSVQIGGVARVPEPSTMVLSLSGFGLLAFKIWRKRSRKEKVLCA